MVTCSVCGTDFAETRTECPCCGKAAPPVAPNPAPKSPSFQPPQPPAPVLPPPPGPGPARPNSGFLPIPPPAALPYQKPAPAPAPPPKPTPAARGAKPASVTPPPSAFGSAPPAPRPPQTAPPVEPPRVPPAEPLGALPTIHGNAKATATGEPPPVELPGKFKSLFPERFRPFLPSFSRWDFAALVGGLLSAVLWHLWARMSVPDAVTPKVILLLPAIFILLRKPIDLLLAPLEVVKSRIPRIVTIGAGLATPYFVANYLYKTGVSNFPLAYKSIFWGSLLSYAIMRVPEVEGLPRLSTLWKGKAAGILPWLFLAGLYFSLSDLAWADDFTRDWRRLEDGMRTPGWAQAIAGTTATVINGLVNGALIFQTVHRRPRAEGEPEDDTHYTLDVRTEEERTKLAADGEDRLWVYGQLTCDKPAVDTASLTRALAFQFGGPQASWMSIKNEQFANGFKAVQIVCTPPTPETEIPEDASVTVTVSGRTADGDTVEVPVTIQLGGGLKMEVEILS